MDRRELLKKSLGTLVLAGIPAMASKSSEKTGTIASGKHASKRKDPRVVVVGGGWSGLALARHLKRYAPQSEITLVEKRECFISCPLSNEWLVDLVDLDFLTHSYIDAARNNGYRYLQATATDVDKHHQILKTTAGDLAYDYLVFAVGIEYDYDAWTHGDKALEARLRREYPAAFVPGSEHLTLKQKIKNFKGGNFVLTVPGGNYRCLAAPYERACLIADYFEKHHIDGKVILMDSSNEIRIKEQGFSSAFARLYKERIVYMPSAEIVHFDLDRKIVETEFDEIKFADASFYPDVRAPLLLEKLGMTRRTPYNRVEADIDQYTYKVNGTHNIYVCGDARPMGFSKSGNTAYTEGINLARMIADEMQGKKAHWKSPATLCFSVLSTKPQYCISLYTEYRYDSKGKMAFVNNMTDEQWQHNGLGKEKVAYNWAKGMYDNMFY